MRDLAQKNISLGYILYLQQQELQNKPCSSLSIGKHFLQGKKNQEFQDIFQDKLYWQNNF